MKACASSSVLKVCAFFPERRGLLPQLGHFACRFHLRPSKGCLEALVCHNLHGVVVMSLRPLNSLVGAHK